MQNTVLSLTKRRFDNTKTPFQPTKTAFYFFNSPFYFLQSLQRYNKPTLNWLFLLKKHRQNLFSVACCYVWQEFLELLFAQKVYLFYLFGLLEVAVVVFAKVYESFGKLNVDIGVGNKCFNLVGVDVHLSYVVV